MELICREDRIVIRPETVQDQAYLQAVLGLRNNGDSVPLICFSTRIGRRRGHIIDLTAKKRRRKSNKGSQGDNDGRARQ